MESDFNIEGAFLMGRDFFNNVAGRQSLFFNEIADLRPATLLKRGSGGLQRYQKRDSGTGVFL